MNRIIVATIVALGAMLSSAPSAFADDAPSAEQMEAAKKAFADGKALHDSGKLTEAIEKFKESYRLSRNPLLLYNIGFTLDEAGQKDAALFYYRKFLSDAPEAAGQRKTVNDRVKVLEKEKLEADLNGAPTKQPEPTPTKQPEPTPTTTPQVTAPAPSGPGTKIKPPGTYGPDSFQHQIVEEAPPGKPLDVTAFVPQDSGFTVTLFYRGAGDSEFKFKPMHWRYNELVARIPGKKVGGSSLQYYIEVKDQTGNVVTRSGKSTSPNLVNIDPNAAPRFYPDVTDEGTTSTSSRHHDEEDPLAAGGEHNATPEDTKAEEPEAPHEPRWNDPGTHKFEQLKWGTTIAAVAALGAGVTFYILASGQASNLEQDSKSCGAPPCRQFDSAYDQQVQSAGQRDQTISNIGIGVGVIGAAVAGYFWYRQFTAKKHVEIPSTAKSSSPDPEMSWIVTPAFGDGFAGAAAAARF